MKKLIVIFVSFVLLQSCNKTLPDEELSMTRIPYYGKEIRIDGYYKGLGIAQKKYLDYIFFYNNGVYFSFGYTDVDNINKIEDIVNRSRVHKDNWGVFQILDTLVNIQRWTQNAGTTQNIVLHFQYIVIDDTTLFYKGLSGDTTRYHFVKFSPKPDSTNVFIK
jgi:hypothetical protein